MQSYSTARLRAEELLRRFVRAEKARRGVKTLSAESFYPVKPAAVAKFLGWHVEATAGVAGYEGSGFRVTGKVQQSNDSKIIRIDSSTPETERNFTIAHEIAHVTLSTQLSDCQYRFRSNRRILSNEQKRKEAEADAFAAALLMPEKAVRARFKKQFGADAVFHRSPRLAKFGVVSPLGRENDRREVAKQLATVARDEQKSFAAFFGVSAAAMTIRLLELELVY